MKHQFENQARILISRISNVERVVFKLIYQNANSQFGMNKNYSLNDVNHTIFVRD